MPPEEQGVADARLLMTADRSPTYRWSAVFMDTLVSVQVITRRSEEAPERARRAFGWFQHVEGVCSRFEEQSEIMRLAQRAGVSVRVSPVLFEAVRFAVEIARRTNGAFDPAVGSAMERRGFNRSYLTGRRLRSVIPSIGQPTYRDVCLDAEAGTVTLARPLVLDLGAVAKGLAIDLAARELDGVVGFAIEAGGDLYVRGQNAAGDRWRVGVRHPQHPRRLACVLHVSDTAVCTSGDYARRCRRGGGEHHLIDPRTGRSPIGVASVTVVAPTALLADGLATAAFVLGPRRGLRLIQDQGVDGMIITRPLSLNATHGMARYTA